jgi:hypothetical protein
MIVPKLDLRSSGMLRSFTLADIVLCINSGYCLGKYKTEYNKFFDKQDPKNEQR